jgi:protein O-mannosyl-transferase
VRRLPRKSRREQRTTKMRSALPRDHSAGILVGISLLLVIGTLAVYSPVRNHNFINYDDDLYVTKNTNVEAGLSWRSVRWAMTSTEDANWHPVTWLSHALDCQLFGMDAGDHHLISVFIHALNALLLFLLLRRATGAAGASFIVAALFAWHPFNVESVAWIAERKNVLSTFFFLLALAAYGWYALKPRWQRMAVVAGVFVLALASKPMVVTLPFALLLLDYWPLQRISGWTERSTQFPAPQQSVRNLLLEKLPLFALAAGVSVLTVYAQKSGGAVRSLQVFPIHARLGNALDSYVGYIVKAIWPAGLAIHYPHLGLSLAWWKPLLAAGFLCSVSLAVWRQRVRRSYLLVGWLWFLGTLVPVIGLVQVGNQAMADRYAYVPLLGLFVMAVWWMAELSAAYGVSTAPRWISAGIVLGILALLTIRQLDYWQDSLSVWLHAEQVTPENAKMEQYLGLSYEEIGDTESAMPHFLRAEELDPSSVLNHVNIGALQIQEKRFDEAIAELETAIKLTDRRDLSADERYFRSAAFLNLGFAYGLSRDYARAMASLREANRDDPQSVDRTIQAMKRSIDRSPSEGGYLNLALLLQAAGRDDEASLVLEKAISENPRDANIREFLSHSRTGPG